VEEGRCTMRKYGFWKFLVDCTMVVLTCGFWLIWIFVREMRHRPATTNNFWS
jgi:hypothetical protein